MKATTIATKYPTLSKVADLLTSCRPVILYDLYDLLSIGYVRPQREAGHGRWTHIEDHRVEIQEALDACSIAVVKFNDAPRRGRTGDIWVLKGGMGGRRHGQRRDRVPRRGRRLRHAGGDLQQVFIGTHGRLRQGPGLQGVLSEHR